MVNFALMANVLTEKEPTTFAEAHGLREWDNAMSEEMKSLTKNQTWDLVELPLTKTHWL
jgi:hypothetical protein